MAWHADKTRIVIRGRVLGRSIAGQSSRACWSHRGADDDDLDRVRGGEQDRSSHGEDYLQGRRFHCVIRSRGRHGLRPQNCEVVSRSRASAESAASTLRCLPQSHLAELPGHDRLSESSRRLLAFASRVCRLDYGQRHDSGSQSRTLGWWVGLMPAIGRTHHTQGPCLHWQNFLFLNWWLSSFVRGESFLWLCIAAISRIKSKLERPTFSFSR
jgi:hypothetical protein